MNIYLLLAGSDNRIRLPEPLIADIVRLFPSIWLHEPVSEVVRNYLSIDDLLEILSEGLSPQEQDLICINCMEGIKLAFDLISDRSDSVTMQELSDRTLKLISEIESRLDNLNRHEDNLVREVAISAKEMAEGLKDTCLFFIQTVRKNRQASQQTAERRAKARATRPEDRERNLPRAVAKRR